MKIKKRERYILYGVCFVGLAIWGIHGFLHRQLVHVGDTQARAYAMLGSPEIEFPGANGVVQWFPGYEITVSNHIVTQVIRKTEESRKERLERKLLAKKAEEELKAAYRVAAEKENISYRAWLRREEKRMREEQERKAQVAAYNKRKQQEKNQVIYTRCR